MRLSRVHCAVLNAATSTPSGLTCSQSYGGHGERETPGNIPNPEAKPLSADGTAPGTGWESRTPPDNHSRTGPQPTGCGPRSACAGTFRRDADQGTARRSPAHDRPPSTAARASGSVTARVTTERSANQLPTAGQVPR